MPKWRLWQNDILQLVKKVFFDKLVDGGVNYPQFAMVTLLRLAACSVPLLIGLTSRCFAHSARASCAPRHCHPHQFPLKSYGFPGAETARKRFLLWKMGFSVAKIAPSPPYTPPGTIETRKGFGSTIRHGRSAPSHRVTCFARAPACAPRCANAYAVFRSCALRVLAPSPLRAFGRSQAHSRLSLVPTIRNSRLASSHRARLRRPGVPPLRTPLCPVSSGLQPLRGLRFRTALR